MKLFAKIFKKVLRTPEIGEIYEFKSRKSPFDGPPYRVQVKAVRDGWVNYRFLNGSFFQNESLKLATFRDCYKLVEE